MKINLRTIQDAKKLVASSVECTPLSASATLSEICNVEIFLKLENLQFTSSFKERGVVSKLAGLTSDEKQRGVIAMSAGNHAQALARHAKLQGIHATLVMPSSTPVSKIRKTQYFEPELVLIGDSLDDAETHVRERIAKDQLVMVHPYDDELVIAGQGTVGLELVEQLPDIETVVVPIGGGGLISGTAIALKSINPSINVVGVQTDLFCTAFDVFHGRQPVIKPIHISIAEGIAVKRPGKLTMPLIQEFVDEIVVVHEGDIEDAIFNLLDIEKTIAEGAGAAALAAVVAHPEIAKGKTVCLISGGNIDPITLSNVMQRNLVRHAHVIRLHVTIQDVPGSLASLAGVVRDTDSNIVDVFHRRSFSNSTIGATIVELTIQLRGRDSKEAVVEKLRQNGYGVSEPDI